jgi:DNA polymerase-3 subunit epsilon
MEPQYRNDDEYPEGQTKPTFTAIDFETANYYRSSACSIGLVRVENGEVVGTFESYIRPYPYWFHPINRSIHGISENECSEAPSFAEIWPQIEHWVKGQILVAHNAPFDRSVLNHLLDHHKIAGEPKDYLCTLYLCKIQLKGLKSYRLPAVYHQLFNEIFEHHQALADSHAASRIALHFNADWNPPAFHRLVRALYDEPFEKRDGRKARIVYSKLTPDAGYESNKQLKGKSFVFTGAIPEMTRYEAAQFVFNHGGKATGGITKSTTHLVISNYKPNALNHYQSSKVKDALKKIEEEAQVINFISDVDFVQIVRNISPGVV